MYEALPGPAHATIVSCSSASLPLGARISDGLRAQIWAGEYVELAVMQTPTRLQHQECVQAYGGVPNRIRHLLLLSINLNPPVILFMLLSGCSASMCTWLCTFSSQVTCRWLFTC